MKLQWACAVASGDSRMATTLSSPLVANRTGRAADIAITGLATVEARSEEIKCSIGALITLSTLNVCLACALTRLRFASVQSADCSVGEAVALLATVWVGSVEIPVERSALVANSSLDSLLALTQFTSWNGSATGEFCDDSSGITIARLAERIIVIVGLARAASFSIEAVLAVTLTFVVAGDSVRAVNIAIASQALGELVEPGHALIATLASKVL